MKVSDEIVEAMTLASKTLYEVIGLDTSSLGVGLGLGGSGLDLKLIKKYAVALTWKALEISKDGRKPIAMTFCMIFRNLLPHLLLLL
jgi:hypothetical protein